MGSGCTALLILLCGVLYPGHASKILCALNPMDTPGELPAKIEFPPIYTATVRYSQWNKTSALVTEEKQNASWRLTRISAQDTTNYIVGKANVTFNATQCSVLSNASALDSIYGVPEQVRSALGLSGFSVSELVHTILHGSFPKKMYANETVVVGGIETVQWVGCQSLPDNATAMQVEVAFAGTDSMAPYSRHIQNPIALSIHVLIYNETDLNVTQHVSFDIVEMDVPQTTSEQDLLEMPRGMYCDGMEHSEPHASLPSKFEASFDYTDLQGKTVHDVDMMYDAQARVVSFRVDVTSDRDAPFVGNASLPKDFSSVTVVHDFKYGLQYIVDAETGVCKELKAINQDFGDVLLLDPATGLIDMKSPVQLIMNISHSDNTYYAGKRVSDEGVPVDVFVSRSQLSPDGSHSVVEMLFTSSPWLFDTSAAPVLYSVLQYHKNSSGAEVGRSVLRMHALRNASDGVTRWSLIPAYTCLRFVEDSYLYVNIKNSSMDALEKIGVMEVQSALRETIAHTASVSVLRVTKFFFKQVMNQVVAFFVIGEESGVAPANTKDRLNESSALEARDLLNSTLMANDVKFTVPGASKTELSLARTSLGVIPSRWSPPAPPAPSFNGYTGGSMFVMAVFMLMLGTGLGVGGMFLLWKRQRLSGLAYQVFE